MSDVKKTVIFHSSQSVLIVSRKPSLVKKQREGYCRHFFVQNLPKNLKADDFRGTQRLL